MSKQTLSLILCIVMLSIVLFWLLFIMHEEYKSSVKKLTRTKLVEEHNKKIKKTKETVNINTRTIIYQYFSSSGYKEDRITPTSHPHYVEIDKFEIDKNYRKGYKIFKYILNVVLFLLLAFVISFGVYSKVTKSIYTINNETYVTIKTGSMATKNKNNEYLENLNLNDQIDTFSLIKLNKVSDIKDIKVYGVYAYKNSDGDLIVHRIIEKVIKDNKTYYTFRGDANDMSDYYLVHEDDVLFEYRGVKNVPLGYFISYLDSTIGGISIIYLIIAFFTLDYYDYKKSKIVKRDLENYVNELNNNERLKLNTNY